MKNGNRAERQHLEYQGLQQSFFMRNHPYNKAKRDSYYLLLIISITMQKYSCFLTSPTHATLNKIFTCGIQICSISFSGNFK